MIELKTIKRELVADTLTPVSIYLRIRDKYALSILLESSDYHGQENSYSYICCEPIARFEVKREWTSIELPCGISERNRHNGDVVDQLQSFKNRFKVESDRKLNSSEN